LSLIGNVPYFVDLRRIADKGSRISGITGLTYHAGCYFAALQSGAQSEIAVLDSSLEVKGVLPLPGVRDIHGLRSDGDRLYVVSTGTNDVFVVDPLGRNPPRLFWTPPAQIGDKQIHINDMIEFRGRHFVLSHRRLDKPGRANGNVFDVDRNEIVAENLLLPHTFLKMDGRLLFCDSHRGQIVELLDSGSVPVFERADRFLRGAALVDDRIILGSSCLRIFSRSRGTAKKYAEEMPLGDEKYMSWLYFLNRGDFSLESVLPFSTLSFEIYDILPVEQEPRSTNLIAQPDAVRTQAIANRMAELEVLLEQESTRLPPRRKPTANPVAFTISPLTAVARSPQAGSTLGFWSKFRLGKTFQRT
jgi:hypothetical protein